MRKSTLVLAISTLMASGVALADGPSVYGKANLNLIKESGDVDVWLVESRASRFGVQGEEGLNDSLTAFYKLEWQVGIAGDDEADTKSENFVARNQYAGIKSGFGSVLMGRNDSPLKLSQGKVDLFNDLPGDIKNLMAGELRVDHIVQYSSPKIAGSLTLNAMFIPGQKAAVENENGPATGQSYSAVFKKDALYAAIAYDFNTNTKGGFVGGAAFERNNITRLVASYKLGDATLSGLYQTAEDAEDTASTGQTEDSYLVSASYKIGDTTLKAQYVASEIDNVAITDLSEGASASVGADYKLSKLTKVYAYYTAQERESEDGSDKEDENSLGLGLSVKF